MNRILAWALFDLANTFFAVAMLSFHFPLWIVEERGGRELSFSMALGASMACVAILMPFCGALSDATGERMRFLRWTTYGCTAATLLVSLASQLGTALVLFGVANVCYQLGTVFYDAVLWEIAPQGRIGQTSGVGAAFGYLGSMVGLLLLWPFVRAGGHQAAFAPSAVFFLIFAFPCFLAIQEATTGKRVGWGTLVHAAVTRLTTTVRSAKRLGHLWRYLWSSFFSLNAINTVLVFMAVYTKKVAGFSEDEVIRFFVFSQLFAIAGSLLLTRLIPRLGSKRTLEWIWFGWMAALTLALGDLSVRWLWVVGPLIGFFLGSTWATSRVLVIELSPPGQLAELLGLAGLFGRASSIIGPLLWGVLVWDPARSRHAILALIGLLALGIWLLHGVTPRPPGRERIT